MTGEKIAETSQMRIARAQITAHKDFIGVTLRPEGEQGKSNRLPRDYDKPYKGWQRSGR